MILGTGAIIEINRMFDSTPGLGLGNILGNALNGIGNIWYCDSVNGSDSNPGTSFTQAFKTLTKAFSVAVSYDTIYMRGTFTEACSSSLTGITLIGAGPTNNDNIWMESAAGQTLLTLTGAQWVIQNIRFCVPTTGGIAILGTGANYTTISNCTFQGRSGSYQAINWVSGDDVKILDCRFIYMNTATYGAGILFSGSSTNVPTDWEIARCYFGSNLRHIVCSMRQSNIHDNIFQYIGLSSDGSSALDATDLLDLSGAGSQFNTVTKNILQGTYSITGGYKPSALDDDWHNNYGPSGLTTVVPA
jgi:hypothetical protein